jgi:sigma-B regulation protein RsbU (phosphoserine phosphatase)
LSEIDLNGIEIMIVDSDGRLISHPNEEWIHNETLQSLAKKFDEPALATLPGAGIDKPPVHYVSPELGAEAIAFAHPLRDRDWTLILGIDGETAYADAIRARNQTIAIGITGLIALLGVIVLLTSRVTKPVALLASTTKTIAGGDLDFELPAPKGHDEIAGLKRDFVHMRDSLRENIAELERETQARQKLESELEIARSIQMGLLPTPASIGGTLREVEIAAKLLPAKAVGGDLYNYFYLDDDTLCFAVGDVSDKGVPAALFMARTNTLVRPATRYFRELDTVLGWLANELTLGNRDCMFVTMLCCAMNLRTGAVSLVNASHLAPLLVRHDGRVELKDIQFGPPLGVSSSATYPIGEVVLEIGDAIVLYSDGVTEAMNEANEEFGEERLLELAKGFGTMPTSEIAGAIVEAVAAHAGEAPQSDDITVLVLRRTTEKTGDA